MSASIAPPRFANGFRRLGVARDLREEGLRVWEGAFPAQRREEGDVECPSVEVAVEVEEVDFEDGLVGARFGESRAEADAADAAKAAAVNICFNGINADGRQEVGFGGEVCRRETMGPRLLAAVTDGLADEVRSAEHRLRVAEAAFGDGGPNARAGDWFALVRDGGGDDDRDAVFASDFGEEFWCAARAGAEAPIRTAVNLGYFAGGADGAREILGRHRGEIRREGAEADPLDAAASDKFQPDRRRRDERRGVGRVDDRAGVAVEGQRPGVSAKLPRAADGLLEDAPVAEVHAVEEPRGEDDGGLVYGVQSVDDQHGERVEGVHAEVDEKLLWRTFTPQE